MQLRAKKIPTEREEPRERKAENGLFLIATSSAEEFDEEGLREEGKTRIEARGRREGRIEEELRKGRK